MMQQKNIPSPAEAQITPSELDKSGIYKVI